MTKQEDLIEKYILNKLSSEEVLLVEELLKNDADFIAEYNFQSNLKTAIKKEDDDNFRNRYQEFIFDMLWSKSIKGLRK